MDIIKVNPEDIDLLVQISWQTFFDSFNHLNRPENMSAYMDKAFTHDKLLSELNNKNSQFYFVKDADATIGYLKINLKDAQTEFKDDISMEVERIYIREGHQSNGYGTKLLDKVKEIALREGIKYVWLGVWEKNPAAIRFL